MGCLAGGAIVQTLGAEMTASNWKWLFDRCADSTKAPQRLCGWVLDMQLMLKYGCVYVTAWGYEWVGGLGDGWLV